MLRATNKLIGKHIDATDGHIGSVTDFYFDDATWTVRYMVVDTGTWLTGRQVLVAPEAVIAGADVGNAIHTRLTKQQIEDSPSIDTDMPVSRQQEMAYRQYFGWPTYGLYFPSTLGFPPSPLLSLPPAELMGNATAPDTESHGDPHLRSIDVVTGSAIEALDGHIGHVSDFLIDEESWAVRYLVVDTRDWLPGKHVLVPPQAISSIDWSRADVHVNLERERIKQAPGFDDPHQIDERYEAEIRSYYAAA